MVVVRSPFPSTVGSTDARARRRRWTLGLLLTGSLALNAYLLLRGEPPPAPPRPAPGPAAAAPGAEDAAEADPELAESGRAVFELRPDRAGGDADAEVARLRERLEPFERMAPGDAIVFSGRELGWILRKIWDLPADDRAPAIARLAGELKRRRDGKDLVLGALFSEEDPRAVSALAAVLAATDFLSAPPGTSDLAFRTDAATMGRIVDAMRSDTMTERRIAAARALGDFGVVEDTMRGASEGVVATLASETSADVLRALAASLRENDLVLQHPPAREALLARATRSGGELRRELLHAYAQAANVWKNVRPSIEDLYDRELSREVREDLAYALGRSSTHSPPTYAKEPAETRARAAARYLRAYGEAGDLRTRRTLAYAAMHTGAIGKSDVPTFVAAMLEAESDPQWRHRLQDAADALARGEKVDPGLFELPKD